MKVSIWARTGLLIATVALAGCVQSLFYQPDHILYEVPSRYGLNFEEVSFRSHDGTELTGWFIPAVGQPDPRLALGTVIHFHGNAQNLSAHWRFAEWLPKHGYNLFAFDPRGYGTSKGTPSPRGVMEDGQAAIQYVRQRADVNPHRLIVFGQSLGGNNALAAIGSGEREGICAVIIESTFASYSSIASDKVPGAGMLMNDDYSADRFIDRISPIPLLLIHGTADPVVPYSHTERLMALAKAPKQLITVPQGDHTQAFAPRFVQRYADEVFHFLASTPPPSPECAGMK